MRGTVAGYAKGFGSRIRNVRTLLGYPTQAALAGALGIKRPGTVSGWETEDGAPEDQNVRLLAQLFENDEEWYRWVREGGTRPAVRPRRPYTESDGAIPAPLVEAVRKAKDDAYDAFAEVAVETNAVPLNIAMWHVAKIAELILGRRGPSSGGEDQDEGGAPPGAAPAGPRRSVR